MTLGNILVTGGAGFIGSHLAENLVSIGHSVDILDNLQTGCKDNIPLKKVKLIVNDLRNQTFMKRFLRKNTYDVIYHLCAQVSVDRSINNRRDTIGVNINGTANLLEAIIHSFSFTKHYPFLIHVSSSEVYGQMRQNPMGEDHPLVPYTPYAATKLGAESLVLAYYLTYAIPTVIIRPFNCYGPRQRGGKHGAVIPNLISQAARGLPPLIHGDGSQTRDFTYVSDTVNALTCLIDSKGLIGETINLGSSSEININRITNLILELMNRRDITPSYTKSPRPRDIKRQKADISKAIRLLDWKPKVNLKQGLSKTIDFFSREKE